MRSMCFEKVRPACVAAGAVGEGGRGGEGAVYTSPIAGLRHPASCNSF